VRLILSSVSRVYDDDDGLRGVMGFGKVGEEKGRMKHEAVT